MKTVNRKLALGGAALCVATFLLLLFMGYPAFYEEVDSITQDTNETLAIWLYKTDSECHPTISQNAKAYAQTSVQNFELERSANGRLELPELVDYLLLTSSQEENEEETNCENKLYFALGGGGTFALQKSSISSFSLRNTDGTIIEQSELLVEEIEGASLVVTEKGTKLFLEAHPQKFLYITKLDSENYIVNAFSDYSDLLEYQRSNDNHPQAFSAPDSPSSPCSDTGDCVPDQFCCKSGVSDFEFGTCQESCTCESNEDCLENQVCCEGNLKRCMLEEECKAPGCNPDDADSCGDDATCVDPDKDGRGDCVSNPRGSCNDNSDCENGLCCSEGQCTSCTDSGCSQTSDCPSGTCCRGGACGSCDSPQCSSKSDCPGDLCCNNRQCGSCGSAGCGGDSDCGDGECCKEGTCQECGDNSCISNQDCNEGDCCTNWKCARCGNKCSSASDCPENQDCCHGSCTYQLCWRPGLPCTHDELHSPHPDYPDLYCCYARDRSYHGWWWEPEYNYRYLNKGACCMTSHPNYEPPECRPPVGGSLCNPPCDLTEECCASSLGTYNCVPKGSCNNEGDDGEEGCDPCKLDKPYVPSAYQDDCIADTEDSMSNLFGYGQPCQLKGCSRNEGAL